MLKSKYCLTCSVVLYCLVFSTGCIPTAVQSRVEGPIEVAEAGSEAESPAPTVVPPPIVVVTPEQSVIVVCASAFRDALAPWIERRTREGLAVTVIDSAATAEDLRTAIDKTPHENCRYIFLVGDAEPTPDGRPSAPETLVPTIYQNADATAAYQETKQLPGDFAYGDFDNDGTAEAAVARVPVKTPKQLGDFIARVIAYEDSTNFSRWRTQVDLIAGLGGFGAMIDGAIEMVASGIVTGTLPGDVRTRVTHASPTSEFHPIKDDFTQQVLANYRDGSRFLVYAGHGWVNELDRVPPTQFGRPVLSLSDLPELQQPADSATIALMLACYTGAFDLREDCLAERMLLTDGGPIAILSGSRVTMPYGNAATAIGLIHAVYHNDHHEGLRLGDAWLQTVNELAMKSDAEKSLQSRRMMVDGIATILSGGARIDDERREHRQIYNWLGDPTLRLATGQTILIDPPGDLSFTNRCTLSGMIPIDGALTVELHRRLGSPVLIAKPDQSKYEAANNTLLLSKTIDVKQGRWECEFEDWPEFVGQPSQSIPIVIKAFASHATDFATGSQMTWIRNFQPPANR